MKVGSLAECHVDMSRPNKRLTSHLLRRTNCVRTSLTPVKCNKTLPSECICCDQPSAGSRNISPLLHRLNLKPVILLTMFKDAVPSAQKTHWYS